MQRRDFLSGSILAVAAMGEASAQKPRLNVELRGGVLHVNDGNRPVLDYIQAPVSGPAGTGELFKRGAYIHPLRAPCGAVVTDDFPADHLHQRGVFFAWTKTAIGEGADALHPDFWNLGSGTGRIRFTKVEGKTRDNEPLRFQTTHLWEARRGEAWEPVLDETWELVLHQPRFDDPGAPGASYILDLTSRQTPRTMLKLPEYRYGGMAVRGAAGWIRNRNGYQLVTSEGKRGETANFTRARWVDMSGEVDGKPVGVALLEHPSNPRTPNPLRVPPGLPYYIFCPSQASDYSLPAGKETVFRYRLVAHNGLADPQALEAEWRRFANRT